MDIMMPRMNGLDAARTIREMKRKDARRVPIIAKPLDAEKMIVALKQCMADNRDVKLHEDL